MEIIHADEAIIRQQDELQLKAESEPALAAEIVRLCATNQQLYARTFFPKTVRQEFPPFDKLVDQVLEGPGRMKMLQIFRGGGKTTKVRLFASRRIAYGISRNIVIVGKSEGHAKRTVKWLKNHVRFNKKWRETFGLMPGIPWTDTECEILQMLPGMEEPVRIHVIGVGITGSIRGINTDDFRPDLIILDDVLDEENASTEDSRLTLESLVYGAIYGSLVPSSEEPNALMVALQTPLNAADYSMKAEKDPDWNFIRISILTSEGNSAWEARWSTTTVLNMKLGFIRRNKLSTWNREYECKLTSPEQCALRLDWVRRWKGLPQYLSHVLVIDPVPPPSDKALRKPTDEATGDYEALGVLGCYGGDFFQREITVNRGHEPLWTCNETRRLCEKFRVQYIIVETIGYQRALAWLLRQAMKSWGKYWPVIEFTDQGSKFNRIVDGLSGAGSQGHYFIPPDDSFEGIAHSEGMRMMLEQWETYPRPSNGHDDALEVAAVGVSAMSGKITLGDDNAISAEEQVQMDQDAREERRTRGGRNQQRIEYAP